MPEPTAATAGPYAVRSWVRGQVQGVGFRWWTRARALERGLTGYARNCADGRVEIWAQGERSAVEALVGLLAVDATGSRPGRVDAVNTTAESLRNDLSGFIER